MHSRFIRLFCIVTAIGAMLLGVSGCSPASAGTKGNQTMVELPKPVTDNGMKLVWGPDVKQTALSLIRQSKHFVYLDMYELSDEDIIAALKAAHDRGVDVRVVLDATEPHSTKVGYPELQQDGVIVRKISIKQGIDHVKMLVSDQDVLMGGMNYGANSWDNNDASVLIPHPNDSFCAMFMWDFARAGGEPAAAPSALNPLVYDHQIELAVNQAIATATKTIDMEAFDLSSDDVVNQLKSALERGVSVTVLVDPSQSYNRQSVETLRDAGAMVRYYRPYHGELMHAKILDVDKGKTFIIGSANFSHQAFTYNHEADLVLHHVPAFDSSLQSDLRIQISRGSDYPIKAKNKSWD